MPFQRRKASAPCQRSIERPSQQVMPPSWASLSRREASLPYVVSKGALQKLMRVLALELAPEVRVNAVAPGTVLPPPDMDEAMLARLASRAPLERIGSAEDVAAAVVYLASAPFVTGQELLVDGGRTVAAGGTGRVGDDPI